MKKGMMVLGIVLATVWMVSGCAILTPPPYVNQKMKVERNGNYYERSVKGFTHSDPDTVIYDWGDTMNMIEDDDLNNDTSSQTGKKDRGYEGIIRNDKYHYSYQVDIYKGRRNLRKILKDGDKHLVASLTIDCRSEEKIKLPYSGKYTIVWKENDKIISHQEFTIRKKVIKKCMGEPCKWYSHMPRY